MKPKLIRELTHWSTEEKLAAFAKIYSECRKNYLQQKEAHEYEDYSDDTFSDAPQEIYELAIELTLGPDAIEIMNSWDV